jgi:uncharacterized protein YecE (DUF72 family)
VYVYFDNDANGRAPADAQALERRVKELLQLPIDEPHPRAAIHS